MDKPLRVYVYSYDFEYVCCPRIPGVCPYFDIAPCERSCSYQIVTGVAMDYWDVYLGRPIIADKAKVKPN